MTPKIRELEAQMNLMYADSRETNNTETYKEARKIQRLIKELYRVEIINQYIPNEWPDEVKTYLYGRAWEDGHSAGYSEIRIVLERMVDDAKFIYMHMVKQSV